MAQADPRLPGWLAEHGIEVLHFPFAKFRPPPDRSSTFKNAFYKHEVLHHLGMTTNRSCVLVDSDCLWARPPVQLLQEVHRGKLLAIDLLEGMVPEAHRNGLSGVSLASFFEEILQQNMEFLPRWIGGELVAGNCEALRLGANSLRDAHERIRRAENSNQPLLPNGHGIFDNDEYLATLAWAHFSDSVFAANAFAARLWTGHDACRTLDDLKYEFWHLPAEKDRGFQTLYSDVFDSGSEFWQCKLDDFAVYLGGHVGIPRRTVVPMERLSVRALHSIKRFSKQVLPKVAWDKLRRLVYERR